MTEEEAQAWVADRYPQHIDSIARFAAMVAEENAAQNLISPTTIGSIWHRHIVDSLQLVPFERTEGRWVDIGTGGGFPGLVVGVVRNAPTVLVEPRRKRAEFLRTAAQSLTLASVTVVQAKADQLAIPAATISARAVASISALIEIGKGCSSNDTRWIMPRGAITGSDMEIVADRFEMFHVEQSLTAPGSSIVVASGLRR